MPKIEHAHKVTSISYVCRNPETGETKTFTHHHTNLNSSEIESVLDDLYEESQASEFTQWIGDTISTIAIHTDD